MPFVEITHQNKINEMKHIREYTSERYGIALTLLQAKEVLNTIQDGQDRELYYRLLEDIKKLSRVRLTELGKELEHFLVDSNPDEKFS